MSSSSMGGERKVESCRFQLRENVYCYRCKSIKPFRWNALQFITTSSLQRKDLSIWKWTKRFCSMNRYIPSKKLFTFNTLLYNSKWWKRKRIIIIITATRTRCLWFMFRSKQFIYAPLEKYLMAATVAASAKKTEKPSNLVISRFILQLVMSGQAPPLTRSKADELLARDEFSWSVLFKQYSSRLFNFRAFCFLGLQSDRVLKLTL